MDSLIPFRQLPAWSPLSLSSILHGLHAAWMGGGRHSRAALEAALCADYRPAGLFLTDSGTSALQLAIRAASAITRAPVALPAYSCYDVATAADGAMAPFLLYDLDPTSLSPDLSSLRRALEAGAGSVVVAHLYGLPADIEAVRRLASDHGAVLIEDAAQGSGCVLGGRPAGAHGALGVLSFGRGKGMTGGQGGALLVNDPRLAPASASAWDSAAGPRTPRGSLKQAAVLLAQWLFGRPWLYWLPASMPLLGLGETVYRPPRPVGGISAFAAGVLVRTLRLSSDEVEHRRANAVRLRARIEGVLHPTPPESWRAGWLRLPVVLHDEHHGALGRSQIREGIRRGYPKPLSQLPGFGARRLNGHDSFPGADLLAARLVTVPTHRYVRSTTIPAL